MIETDKEGLLDVCYTFPNAQLTPDGMYEITLDATEEIKSGKGRYVVFPVILKGQVVNIRVKIKEQ